MTNTLFIVGNFISVTSWVLGGLSMFLVMKVKQDMSKAAAYSVFLLWRALSLMATDLFFISNPTFVFVFNTVSTIAYFYIFIEGDIFKNIAINFILAFTFTIFIAVYISLFSLFFTEYPGYLSFMSIEFFTSVSQSFIFIFDRLFMALLLPLTALLIRKILKRVSINKNVGIALTLVFMVFQIYNYFVSYYLDSKEISTDFAIFIGLLLFLTFALATKLSFDNAHKKQLLQENLFLSQHNELQYKYYEEQNEYRQKIREIHHDIESHIRTMQILFENGDNEEYRNYEREFLSAYSSNIKYTEFCENKIVAAVLSDISRQAREKNIEFTADVNIPEDFPIKPVDMMSIMSNLLNNAIENCVSTDGKPKVQITASRNKDSFVIKCENTFSGNISIEKDKTLKTTKTDKFAHGLGMKIISKTVKKYNGDTHYETKDGYFTYVIVFHNLFRV
ncbi:MAG: GHKL domain-containing protein [Clostridiales bacterium]|jgi:signal transduction histidine kinase|nr:GHKL domain-containing protein [Clostridiales bacterium]